MSDIVVTRIDASFEPSKWTCMYDVAASKQGPSFSLHEKMIQDRTFGARLYYLPSVPVEVSEYFDQLRDRGALRNLIHHPDDIPDMEDVDQILADSLVADEVRDLAQQDADDDEN